jgi:xanthine phosphoribosyltransferase
MMPVTRTLSWAEIDDHARKLADRLKAMGPFTGIAAVTRGGLVPAALLAQWLDIRTIETISVQSYVGDRRDRMAVLKPPPAGDGTGWLVVDDLADSGTTLRTLRGLWPRARFATLYAKPQGKDAVDDFITEVDQSVWLAFPWEK